jgi:XTP/dITP diphosphohydrolase
LDLNRFQLLLGTRNSGKIAEIQAVLADLPIVFHTLEEFPTVRDVEECGASYEENAALKARGYARLTGLWAVADDSGLEVDALAGAPGILSARYAGAKASDSDRIKLVLDQLAHVPSDARSARFVCVIAIADPSSGLVQFERGACEGTITRAPHGRNGFGFDPIFIPQGFNSTFAELPSEIKNSISHRAKALVATHDLLSRLIDRHCTTDA